MMIQSDSKTLREFSAKFKSKSSTLTVFFGYDTAANHSGFYIEGSLNNGIRTASKEMLVRINTLGVKLFDRLIEASGTDVYGMPYDFDTNVSRVIEQYFNDELEIDDLDRFYRLDSNSDCPHCVALSAMLDAYDVATTDRQRANIITKFTNSQRERLIGLTRDLIRDIRDAYFTGIAAKSGDISQIDLEGALRRHANPTYYKRDIDYVRKARVRLFRDVLLRKYRPFAN